MGVLIDGAWHDGELPQETGASGEFRRADSRFRERITADGSSGFQAEAGRYHLYVAHGCPWAHRTLIYRSVKKLQGAITVAYSVPGLRQQGWTFDDEVRFDVKPTSRCSDATRNASPTTPTFRAMYDLYQLPGIAGAVKAILRHQLLVDRTGSIRSASSKGTPSPITPAARSRPSQALGWSIAA
jgi:glutathionyl-hydroquinone reductase